MAIIGPRASIDLALPSGIDSSRVLNFMLRDQRTGLQLIEEVASAIGVVNEQVLARYGGFVHFTQSPYAYYAQGAGGSRRVTPKKVEFKQAPAVRGDVSGGMLPLDDFEDALAWTPLYLRDAYPTQIEADIQVIVDSWQGRVSLDLLTRMFSKTENAIGSGYDVPWAIGTGVNVPYIPLGVGTVQFSSSHTHFLAGNAAVSATSTAAALEAAITEIRHHGNGYGGRLVALVSEADLASYTGITSGKFVKFVAPGFVQVTGGSNQVVTSTAEITGFPGEIFGYYMSDHGVVELRWFDRIPTGYLWVTKSFGSNHPLNGLAIREHPTVGFGLHADPQLTASINPELEKVLVKGTHGVGVNNRINGVAVDIVNATYTNPTIT